MEGEIKKWTNMLLGYQIRYCVITGEMFYYYNKKGEDVKGKVHLGISKLEDSNPDSEKFELDSGSNYYYFKANNLEEKQKWVRAIKEAKFNANKPQNKGLKANKIANNDNALSRLDNFGFEPDSNSISLNLPERLSYIRNLALKLSDNNIKIHKHLAENYDLGQDEPSISLLNMLSDNKHQSNVFQYEFDLLLTKLSGFSINLNNMNTFLNSGNNEIFYDDEIKNYINMINNTNNIESDLNNDFNNKGLTYTSNNNVSLVNKYEVNMNRVKGGIPNFNRDSDLNLINNEDDSKSKL